MNAIIEIDAFCSDMKLTSHTNYPLTLKKWASNTRHITVPALGVAALGMTGNLTVYTALMAAAFAYSGEILPLRSEEKLRRAMRHELGHVIGSLDLEPFVQIKSIDKLEQGGFQVDRGCENIDDVPMGVRGSMPARLLNRLAGKTLPPYRARFDHFKEYGLIGKLLLKNPQQGWRDLKHYMLGARREMKALLRQYPEKLIEDIVDEMVRDFKDAPIGPVWTRDNNKIQELEARLKEDKIKSESERIVEEFLHQVKQNGVVGF